MNRNRVIGWLLAAIGFGGVPVVTWASEYTFKAIDLGPGFVYSAINGINSSGLATGTCYTNQGVSHGLVVKNGVPSLVSYPGGLGLMLGQVNDEGIAAGSYLDRNSQGHAILYNCQTKTFSKIPDISGTTINIASGVNATSVVAGYAESLTSSGETSYEGWVYGAMAYQTFEVFGADANGAYLTVTGGINDAGTVVGSSRDTSGFLHGYLATGSDGPFTIIDYPSAQQTSAIGINNAGTVVGFYQKGTNTQGFILTGGTSFSTVNFPRQPQTRLNAINDQGDLGGAYVNAGNRTIAFIASKK